jgi:hypothetical protein
MPFTGRETTIHADSATTPSSHSGDQLRHHAAPEGDAIHAPESAVPGAATGASTEAACPDCKA